MKKELYCIKDIYEYKKGEFYKYREEDEHSIYIYYHNKDITHTPPLVWRIGNKFSIIESHYLGWLVFYKNYFIT